MRFLENRGGVSVNQKTKILEVLKNRPMTQGELAFSIYGDYKHIPNIYSALMSLVNNGEIVRTGNHPSFYSLTKKENLTVNIAQDDNIGLSVNNNQSERNVILLNKPFLGGWLNREGNIGHEVIDFLETDNGDYYVYNNPWGICPNNIWIEGTKSLQRMRSEKCIGKFMVLTSETRGRDFNILYVIELSEKIHRFHTSRDDDMTEFRTKQDEVKKIMRERNIKYNGKFLDEIYREDDSLYLTFKGSRIWKANVPILVQGLKYNFQRNKGYIYDDVYPNDYQNLIDLINNSIKNGALSLFSPRRVDRKHIDKLNSNRTFLDLINMDANEQVFTDILHSILEQGDMFSRFCERFRDDKPFDSTGQFIVFRETKVVDGRIDVCAESNNQRVIIENKIYSGLNGLKPADSKSQLSTYYHWGKDKDMEPLCMVVAPNFRIPEIKREMKEKDPSMVNVYLVKTYGDIADFIYDEFENNTIPNSYAYYDLLPQIINAFRNLSYSTKEDLYARMFLDASN